MTEIIVENVTKSFGGENVLENVSFKVKSNDITVLLGPSRAGKTTLLRIIAGTESPDRGRILFDGDDVTNKPTRYRNVGFVFQTFALYPHMTVYDNIASPLRAEKIPEEEIRKRVHEITEVLRISHILNKRPQECSGGEAQRVGIARAIVKNPKVLLLDDPLTNLDYKVREVLRIELKRILKKFKMTVIFSTPNAEEAAALGDTLIHIREGRIIQTGSIKDCFKYPVDLKAAMSYSPYGINVLSAKCLGQGDNKVLKVNDELFINVGHNQEIYEGDEYLIGIYPHNIYSSVNEEKNMLKIPVKLDHIENLGSELIMYLRFGDNILRMFSGEVGRIHEFKQLRQIFVPVEKLMIFKKSDGVRVCNLEASP